MRLDNLIVEGMFVFDTRVTLPARDLPRGLIAIVGPNGEGKTALVESTIAAFHREFPSKPNELPHYATRRGAFIEADWTLDDVGPLRARLNIDPISRKVDATLSQLQDGTWKPLNDKGQVSTFDPLVRKLFPSFNVLLATAFASQNRRGAFSDLGQTDRKKLFGELLGLERYERWAAGCAEVVRAIERRRAELMPWVTRLRQETTPELQAAIAAAVSSSAAALAEAVAKVAAADDRYRLAEAGAGEARSAAAAAAERQLERAAAQSRRDRAQFELDQVATDRSLILKRAEDQRKRIRDSMEAALTANRARIAGIETDATIDAALTAQVAEIRTRAETEIAGLQDRIRNNEALQADEAAVRAAARTLDALEAARTEVEADLEVHDRAVDAAERRLVAAREEQRKDAGWPDRLAAAERSSALIGRVPFGAKCAEAKCEFVTAAVDAQQSIPECRAGVARLQAATAAVEARTAEKAAAVTARDAVRQRGAELRATIGRDHLKTRERVATLDQTAERIAERTQQIAGIDARGKTEVATADQQAQTRKAAAGRQRTEAEAEERRLEAQRTTDHRHTDEELTNVLEVLQGREQAARAAAATAAGELEALAATEPADGAAAAALTAMEAALSIAAAGRHAEAEGHGVMRTVHEGAVARQADLARRLEEAAKAEHAIEDLGVVETQWRFFAAAFGRDGLPNLEIDAAGPIITELANSLLCTCFGEQRFTIEIVTQQAKAKGGLKESFEMLVYDGRAAGKPRDLGDLSGGQRILVDEAVKCALAIYMNDKTRAKLRTCFRDETTGNLHQSFIPLYIDMLRRVRERGGFDQLFFVTHNAEAAAMADCQVVVNQGTVTVRLPPFDDAPATWDVITR